MLYVKIMSGEDLPDTNPHKNYSIIPVEKDQVMQFVINPLWQQDPLTGESPATEKYHLIINSPDGSDETHPLWGNAYVMTETGKTIATHGC